VPAHEHRLVGGAVEVWARCSARSLRPAAGLIVAFPSGTKTTTKCCFHTSAICGHLTGAYRLRALVELSNGRTDAAFDDVQTCLRLAGTIKHEPLIIPFLVRVALIDLGTQPIWEGLAAHCWDDNQLAALQASFENMDQFGSFDQAIHGERLLASHTVQWLQAHPEEAFEWSVFMQEESPSIRLRRWFGLPSACFYHSELSVDQFYTEMFYLPLTSGISESAPRLWLQHLPRYRQYSRTRTTH